MSEDDWTTLIRKSKEFESSVLREKQNNFSKQCVYEQTLEEKTFGLIDKGLSYRNVRPRDLELIYFGLDKNDFQMGSVLTEKQNKSFSCICMPTRKYAFLKRNHLSIL